MAKINSNGDRNSNGNRQASSQTTLDDSIEATIDLTPKTTAKPPAKAVSASSSQAIAPTATDETLSQVERDEVMALLTQVRQKLPFLRDLTAEERRAAAGIGDRNRAFITKALEIAVQNSDFLPRSFDLERMQATVTLFDRFYGISLALMQLHDLAEATAIAIGSEAYEDALTIYRYAKASGQGASLESLLAEMGQRFAKSSRKSKQETEIEESDRES